MSHTTTRTAALGSQTRLKLDFHPLYAETACNCPHCLHLESTTYSYLPRRDTLLAGFASRLPTALASPRVRGPWLACAMPGPGDFQQAVLRHPSTVGIATGSGSVTVRSGHTPKMDSTTVCCDGDGQPPAGARRSARAGFSLCTR